MNVLVAESPSYSDCQWVSVSVVKGWDVVWQDNSVLSSVYRALHPEVDIDEWKRAETERLVRAAKGSKNKPKVAS